MKRDKPTKAMIALLREMKNGAELSRAKFATGHMLITKSGARRIAYPMPTNMEDMGLIRFIRDNEEDRFSREFAVMSDKAHALLTDKDEKK